MLQLRSPAFRSAGRLVLAVFAATFAVRLVGAQSSSPQPALRVVVIDGEDAVNIVQQKTAVAPVVEVRDRNNQPISGVVVQFAITRGRATFSGARAMSVVTNAAGRATVAGLTPTGAGTLQISATAAFQGQTAAVTIAQTNVMTAAQAAAVSGSASSASSGGGAAGAGGAGGGLSATTVAIVGGAAAAGSIVAINELKGETNYSGAYAGLMEWRNGPNQTCSHQSRVSGPVRLALNVSGDGTVTGTAHTSGGNRSRLENVSSTCPNPPTFGVVSDYYWLGDPGVSGTTSSLTFHGELGPGFAINWVFDFNGSLNGDTITGTLLHSWVNVANGFVQGTVRTPVTLTRQ